MRALLCLMLAFVLPGCGGKPDADTLRATVSQQIALALPSDTVELTELQRRGSQGDTKAPAGETRRVLYYDAELKLKRDFNFGSWDAAGVAGLVSALGAGPKGISGITAGGNKAGDTLHVHGTAVFRRDGDQWTLVVPGGYRAPQATPYTSQPVPQGLSAVLAAMNKVMESVPSGMSPAEQAVIHQELGTASTNIRGRLARLSAGYAVAAGEERGQYQRLAQAIAASSRVRVVPLITHGGEENIQMLRDGKAALAIAQGDAALDAYEGRGAFAPHGPYTALRAIGSLYPEAVHVVVRATTPFTAVGGLRGKPIAIGPPGSASRTTALRVLDAHGIGPGDMVPHELDIGAALVALQAGTVDAAVLTIGTPADSVRDALTATTLRLLPLSAPAIAALTSARHGYFAYTITKGSYPEQAQDVRTIGTAAILLAASDLSDTEIEAVTRLVFGKGQDFTAHGSAQGARIGAQSARLGLTIPQHLAATRVLEDIATGTGSK